MKYGNCLFGALVLLWRERHNSPKFLFKARVGTKVPHFMVRTQDQLHHYKTDKDLLPWPFCYLLFQGSFQSVPLDQEDDYAKLKNRK